MPTLADIYLRDFVRYTGDGLPNEPVGHPAPIGDPSSGVHHPTKADLRYIVGAAEVAAGLAASSVPAQTFATAEALKAVQQPLPGVVYTIANTDIMRQYVWVQGSTVPEDAIGLTVLAGLGGRWVAVDGGADEILILLMGQSNAVGADPNTTGAVFNANVRVQVWDETIGAFKAPVKGAEPFNPSGSYNAGLAFANKIAETTGRQVRLVVIADGSRPISDWTGANGTEKTVENRPKYMEMMTALDAIGRQPDVMVWIQGEADGASGYHAYRYAFLKLMNDMTADGYLGESTPVIVSQLYQGDHTGNGASSNAYLANQNIWGLTTLGDPRIRVASSQNLPAGAGEVSEGAQTAAVHFTDAALDVLGRDRIYNAWLGEVGDDFDYAAAVLRTARGWPGMHSMRTARVSDLTVPGPGYVVSGLTIGAGYLGGMVEVEDGASVYLPDYTHPTKYSSSMKNRIGVHVELMLIENGSFSLAIEPGGTGKIQQTGSIGNAAVTAMQISAANTIYRARWNGNVWQLFKMSV